MKNTKISPCLRRVEFICWLLLLLLGLALVLDAAFWVAVAVAARGMR